MIISLEKEHFSVLYSERKATTGSFLLAYLDGISPDIIVNPTDMIIKVIPPAIGNEATFFMPDKFSMMMFIGMFSKMVMIIPNVPDINPIMNVSALNTLETSFFLAPIALKIPISLVLSRTDM